LVHKSEIDAAIARVLDSGQYILGQEVAAFEQDFASFLGVRYAVGAASGTDSLHLALRACGIGSGDSVITVSHTAVATVAAIELVGATPLLVDIDPATFTMDPNYLEDAIKNQSIGQLKAIVPVHLYGHPADIPSILDIADRYGLYVIEDCAQSHGAELQGRKTGALGHIAAFSFYPTKNLAALGDGGIVVTNEEHLAERVRLLRQYGWRQRQLSEIAGINSRLDELQAAVLRVKLAYLEKENRKRQALAKIYDEALLATSLILPTCNPRASHVYHQYVVRSECRDPLREFLREKKIGTLIHYPVPIHHQPAYQGRLRCNGSLANTEKVVQEILSLPIYPELSDSKIEFIADAIRNYFLHQNV
jgi:dTDP-4-amino-4,6-dideoxygalactose transaminase